MIETSSLKLCSIISLALLFGTVTSSATIAHEDDYSNFPTGEHEGGGVRGKGIGCLAADIQNPQALIASKDEVLTISATPELLFYVPDVDQASTLEIRLTNENDRVVSQRELIPGERAGIISVNLLDNNNNNALELNSLYSWSLIRECAGVSSPKVVARGLLRRIKLEPGFAQQLQQASPEEQIKLYQSANLWYEAIANTAQFKCHNLVEKTNAKLAMKLENTVTLESLFTQSLDTYCSAMTGLSSIVSR